MKKYLILLLLAIIISPSVTLASWWNPFSWRDFNKTTETKIERPVIVLPINTISKSTTTNIVKKETKVTPKEITKKVQIVQKEENVDLKIAQCKAIKDNSYNGAVLKLNQAIDTKLQETFNSLEQQYKTSVQKIHDKTNVQISRINNDSTLTGYSKTSLIGQYNQSDSEQVKSVYENQQTFWRNQKQEIENSKQKAMDQINLLLGDEYAKCLSN